MFKKESKKICAQNEEEDHCVLPKVVYRWQGKAAMIPDLNKIQKYGILIAGKVTKTSCHAVTTHRTET